MAQFNKESKQASLTGLPSDNQNQPVKRYWKEKIAQIKTYIKVHKYDIQIPKILQFEDSEDEMMDEARAQVEAQKKRQNEAKKVPRAN